MPWIRNTGSRTSTGIVANAIDVVVETGDSGPITPIGINLPNDQAIRETYGSKSVALSNVTEAYDKSTPGVAQRVLAGRRRRLPGPRSGAVRAASCTPTCTRSSGTRRDGRPRAEGQPEKRAQGAFSALEEGARGSRRALLPRRSEACRTRRHPGADHDAVVRAEYEAYTRNALVQLRRVREGSADRGRPHAQPADDRPLADGEHEGHRGAARATARPTRDGRRRRSVKASAGCSPRSSGSSRKATTPAQRSCSTHTASTSIRSCATRSSTAWIS